VTAAATMIELTGQVDPGCTVVPTDGSVGQADLGRVAVPGSVAAAVQCAADRRGGGLLLQLLQRAPAASPPPPEAPTHCNRAVATVSRRPRAADQHRALLPSGPCTSRRNRYTGRGVRTQDRRIPAGESTVPPHAVVGTPSTAPGMRRSAVASAPTIMVKWLLGSPPARARIFEAGVTGTRRPRSHCVRRCMPREPASVCTGRSRSAAPRT
jgi:hypothetical protein